MRQEGKAVKTDIVIFGTGKSSELVLDALKMDNVAVTAFADNNFNKHGTLYKGIRVVNPVDLTKMGFSFVIIAVIKYHSVVKQLLESGIKEEKIVPYFDTGIIGNSKLTDMFFWERMFRDNYNIKLKKIEIKLENLPYELVGTRKLYTPEVRDITETMDMLVHTDVSISRFGDGEMKLMAGNDIGFQKASPQLAERLKEVLKSQPENHITGILDVFGSLAGYTDSLQDYFREYLHDYNREFQYGLLNINKTYYNAFITRPYISYKDKQHAGEVFENFKKIWDGQDILIVEGDRTRLGRGNDLFNNVKSCKRIICPNENAFEKYGQILGAVKKQDKGRLVLLALGPTATILAYDLAKEGFRAVDIGHIDIEYEWYLMGATEKVAVKNKYTNEAYGGNQQFGIEDKEYEKQIVVKVSL